MFLFCIFSSVLFIAFLIWRPDALEERAETLTLDYRFYARNFISRPLLTGEVVIVAIDERSLQEYGRWPWSRTIQAELVKKIVALNPKVLAVDIFYTETENEYADKFLGEALQQAEGKIVLASVFDVWVAKRNLQKRDIPEQMFNSAFLKLEDQKQIRAIEAQDLIVDVEPILRNNISGHTYSHPDRDGKLRWEILYLKYQDEFFPSFALQTARLALGLQLDDLIIAGNRGVKLGNNLFIPTDLHGRLVINYYGKERTFKYISVAEILQGNVQRKEIENHIIFLGTSAIATYDLKNTPFSGNMPGVEKNATVVENIITSNFLKKSSGYLEIIFVCLSGLLSGIFLPRLSAIKGATLSFAFFSGYIVLSLFVFSFMNLWINLIYPATNIIFIAIVVTVTKYFFEERKAKEIRKMFSSYVSPKIVEQLISNPDKTKLGGDRKTVTILFSDIIGFTTLSEKTSPEKVVELLNEYFEKMSDIIFKWDGTLDKFVGDEIMVFWGAPVNQPNHTELATRCALHMVTGLEELHKKWISEGKPILDCGIGINTGEVVIGNIGAAGKKMDYTVIGDHVNLAARAEKLTRDYNAKIIITEFTLKHIMPLLDKKLLGHIEINELDRVKVKGREQEVKIFELKNLKIGGNTK